MPQINGARLIADLRRLAQFGAYKSGVHRPTFSPQDIEARRWLAERFTEAGLDSSINGIGNVFGRSRATGRKALATAGLAGRKRETIVASDTIGYLEAHIEQGE